MAKFRTRSKVKKSGIVKLKSLLMGRKSSSYCDDYEEASDHYVPEDVKEGHFAVIAVDGEQEQPKRFVIPLSYLSHPRFIKLLEKAAEEYGFDHEGALTIPCRPCEIQTILEGENAGSSSSSSVGVNWGCYEAMVQSC